MSQSLNYPLLTPSLAELTQHHARSARLADSITHILRSLYGLEAEVVCRGSSDKNTMLPERYFGLDYDMSITGTPDVLDKIASRSSVFEGCQLFRTSFAIDLSRHLDDIHSAGHRISGEFERHPFDISIADPAKDSWKIEYNNSAILDFDDDALQEVRAAKFLFKRLNVYGSKVYGVVGPAVELAVYHWKTVETILSIISDMSCLPDRGRGAFRTVAFPTAYKKLFPEQNDFIHMGLVNSFRYTLPNTFNRLIEVAKRPCLAAEDFLAFHQPGLPYRTDLPTNDPRAATLYLATLLPDDAPEHMELLRHGSHLSIHATSGEGLPEVKHMLAQLPSRGIVPLDLLPACIALQIGGFSDDDVVFRGLPPTPLDQRKHYIPFDALLRDDAKSIVEELRRTATL